MKKIKLLIPILTLCTLGGMSTPLISCGNNGGDTPTPPPEVIKVQSIEINGIDYVENHKEVELSLKILPENATDKTISWECSDPSKVSIYSTEDTVSIYGVSPGDVTITAKANDGSGVTESFDFSVIWPFYNHVGYFVVNDEPKYFDSLEDTNICGSSYSRKVKVGAQEISISSFNYPIYLSSEEGVVYTDGKLPDNFLYYATHFNSKIIFPNQITSIGDGFLNEAEMFSKDLILPKHVVSIGNNFLRYCDLFNSKLVLPNQLQNIGSDFLAMPHPTTPQENRFNQSLIIPETVSSIGDEFLQYCQNFNQPLTLPNNLTNIGNRFLDCCYNFNQPLTLPSNLKSIGYLFMQSCDRFDQTLLIPDGLETIDNGFMSGCYDFNKPLTLPNTLTGIGSSFLTNCWCLTSQIDIQDINPTFFQESDQTLATSSQYWPLYETGVPIVGTYSSEFRERFQNGPHVVSSKTYYRNLK